MIKCTETETQKMIDVVLRRRLVKSNGLRRDRIMADDEVIYRLGIQEAGA